MTQEEKARIHQLEQTLDQMEAKSRQLGDDIEYIKQKIAISKIEAAK